MNTLTQTVDSQRDRTNMLPAPLGEQLVRASLLTPQELETALGEQQSKKMRLGETLVELGFVDEEQLLPFIAENLGVPFVKLREGLIDPAVVRILPHTQAKSFSALALFCVKGELTVAMAEPQNLHLDNGLLPQVHLHRNGRMIEHL